jgi:hypothetical protein
VGKAGVLTDSGFSISTGRASLAGFEFFNTRPLASRSHSLHQPANSLAALHHIYLLPARQTSP